MFHCRRCCREVSETSGPASPEPINRIALAGSREKLRPTTTESRTILNPSLVQLAGPLQSPFTGSRPTTSGPHHVAPRPIATAARSIWRPSSIDLAFADFLATPRLIFAGALDGYDLDARGEIIGTVRDVLVDVDT